MGLRVLKQASGIANPIRKERPVAGRVPIPGNTQGTDVRHTSPTCPVSRGYLGSGTCVFTLNGLDPAPPPEPGFFCPFGAAPPAQTIAPPHSKAQAARYQLTAR